jgi:hypothetical protein
MLTNLQQRAFALGGGPAGGESPQVKAVNILLKIYEFITQELPNLVAGKAVEIWTKIVAELGTLGSVLTNAVGGGNLRMGGNALWNAARAQLRQQVPGIAPFVP